MLAPISRIGLGASRPAAVRIGRASAQADEIEHMNRTRPVIGAEGGESLSCRVDVAGHAGPYPHPALRATFSLREKGSAPSPARGRGLG